MTTTTANAVNIPGVNYASAIFYNHFFGLSSQPFQLTPDTDYLFSHASWQDALNKLLFATQSGEGFTKIVGEVGTGKTLLCRKFLNMLEEHYVTAYIPNPYLEPMTLLLAIADELGIAYSEQVNQHQLLKSLTHFLIETFDKTGKTVVVCLDEAHALPLASLEALRLLSNLETSKRKLLQLVLFGQPELNQRLEHKTIRQLQQRISFFGELTPLNFSETEDYIWHRLNVAGYRGPRLFSSRVIKFIFKASGGVPRLINILCHKALIAAYADHAHQVTARHVSMAIEDTDSLPKVNRVQKQHSLARNYLTVLAVGSVLTALAAYISRFT